MKKKLLAIIALLVAFVMSFSLIACGNKNKNPGGGGGGDTPGGGGDTPGGGGDTPTLTATKIETALDNITNAGTLELHVTGMTSSKENTEGDKFDVKATVSGDAVKLEQDGKTQIVDIGKSYMYAMGEDGKYYVSMLGAHESYFDDNGVYSVGLPSGAYNYLADIVSGMLSDVESGDVDYSEIVKLFSYDKDYGGFVTNIEAKDEVNAPIEFVQDLYADDASLLDTVDAVLAKAFGEKYSVEYLLGFAASDDGYGFVKDISLYNVVKMVVGNDADDLFDYVFGTLADMGLELDAAEQAAIKDRTIGEMLAGVASVIPQLMEGGIDMEEFNPMMIVGPMFFYPATPEEVDAIADIIKEFTPEVVRYLDNIKIKSYIDTANPEFKAMVATENFAFETVNAKIGFKMTDSDITELKIDGLISHNYKGDTKDLHFLRNNDYKVTVTVAINAKKAATDFLDGIEYAEHPYGGIMTAYGFDAVVSGYTKGDVTIYLETCGKTITISDVDACYYDDEGERVDIEITYNDKITSLVISHDVIEEFLDAAYDCDIYLICNVSDGTNKVKMAALIHVVPDESVGSLVGFLMEHFRLPGGGGNKEEVAPLPGEMM